MRLKIFDGILYLWMKLLKKFDSRARDIADFVPENVRNILIVSSTAIGDTLLSTPAIKAVRDRYPEAKIIGHFNVNNMKLFDNNPHIDGIIPYYGGYKRFFSTIKEFKRHRFDLALILHGNEPQATPMVYLSETPFIIKLPNTGEYGFLLSNRKPVLNWSAFGHGVNQRLKVAELADCNPIDIRMVLPLKPEGDTFINKYLAEKKLDKKSIIIGFQAAASTVSRMWFGDRYTELGRKLVRTLPKIRIIVTGSPKEASLCSEIASGIGKAATASAGEIPLEYIPALCKRFSVLLTPDTGIMHMAIAVGTPVVALFAAADAEGSGPYYDLEKHTIIQRQRTCSPCKGKRCTYQKCMEAISVEEVFELLCAKINKEARTEFS